MGPQGGFRHKETCPKSDPLPFLVGVCPYLSVCLSSYRHARHPRQCSSLLVGVLIIPSVPLLVGMLVIPLTCSSPLSVFVLAYWCACHPIGTFTLQYVHYLASLSLGPIGCWGNGTKGALVVKIGFRLDRYSYIDGRLKAQQLKELENFLW